MKKFLLLLLLAWTAQAACVPPPNTYDFEAELWRSQVLTNGFTLSGVEYRAGTVFMQHARQWGIRPYLGRVSLYVGTNLNAMLSPIIRDWHTGAFDQPDSAPNFVDGDFSDATGLTGNTSTKYVGANGASGLFMDSFTTGANIHFATYARTATAQDSFAMGIQTGSNPTFFLSTYQTANYAGGQAGNVFTAFTDTNGVGFYMVTRRATNDLAMYLNGTLKVADATGDLGALPHLGMVIHALNTDGSIVLNNGRTYSYYALGYGFPAALTKSYNDLVQDAQIPFNRQK